MEISCLRFQLLKMWPSCYLRRIELCVCALASSTSLRRQFFASSHYTFVSGDRPNQWPIDIPQPLAGAHSHIVSHIVRRFRPNAKICDSESYQNKPKIVLI